MKSNDHLIGKQLGTCVLEREIGAGGMGMVYLAHQTRPVRDVAVKVLRSGAGIYTDAHKEFLARFRREANVIARLDHVNILPIYEYDEQDELAYLVMPYLTGGSLRTLLEERGKLSPQEAFKYIEQAGSALQYAHEHKIIHRDIKPGNILFHADGRLVLVDFGIARITREGNGSDLSDPSLTAFGQFLGSVEYMAPEMVQGHDVDNRADLYELGIVLFQMLTGRVPFQGASVLSIAAKHINEMPPSLTRLDSSIPLALERVVLKALAKRPEDRYSSAREMVEAVRIVITAPLSPLLDVNSSPSMQSSASSQLSNGSNPASQAVQNAYYPFENSNRLGPPANTPHGSMPNVPYTSAPGNVAHTPHGSMPYFPSTNTLNATQDQNMSTPYFGTLQNPQTSITPYSNHVQNRPHKSPTGLNWILAFCVVIVLCMVAVLLGPRIIANFSPAPNPAPIQTPLVAATATVIATPTPTPTPAEAAEAVVQLYFSDVNKADFMDAYQQWSAEYQQQNSYSKFLAGYAQTKHDEVTYGDIVQLADGSYQINVSIATTEVDDNGTTVNKNFQGYYVVGLDAGALKLLLTSKIHAA